MRILVVHQYYLGPGEPGGSRFNEMARFWRAAGHDVTIVAGSLNYTTNEVPEYLRGRWTVRGVEEGVTVWRCYVPASYGRSYPGRMWAFFGFTLSAVTAVLRAAPADVIVATSPPLVTAIPGWVAARLRRRRAPWIFEIRDLWPESAVSTGVLKPDGVLTRLLYFLERWACRSATRVNVLTPAFRDDLVARGLALENKIAFIPNGADVEAFRPGPRDNDVRREFGWGDRTVFLYAGAHGRANAAGQLLEAAEGLRHRADILIATVGDGPERAGLQSEARRRGLPNVLFHGAQAKQRMPDCVNACDVGVAVLKDSPTFRTVYPNKVFDYMACERPTLLAIDGVARRLVCEEARAGVYVQPEDGPAIARAMIQMANDPQERAAMGRRGHAWVMANATRESLARKYLDVMREIVSP